MTYLPSLYGPSNMKFNGKDHFIVDPNKERWQQTILKRLNVKIFCSLLSQIISLFFIRINDEAVTRGRPVLVFFESEERISEFLSSDYGRRMPPHQLIVESTIDVPFRVSKATAPSQVTLLSRVFGRGLDFKVNHPSIESVDGVCVICTFFPDSASEEIQIKGRAARQGKKGTFEFILCQPDVQRDFSATPEQLKDSPYEFLVKKRTTQTDQLLDAKIEQVCSLHKMLHLH
jgi:preprotein translocase subunit SecA